MNVPEAQNDLGIADRIHRSQGRPGRVIPASTKVTRDEHKELEAAAKREGKALSEWFRDVLLLEARSGPTDTAVFTELIAFRMLMSTILRRQVLRESFTAETYAQILAEVKANKHDAAKDVLTQYQNPTGDK
jgi:hypothetical protein